MKRPGFSLIEVLIASLVFVLVISAGSTSFLGSVKTATKTKVTQDSVQQARFALETMVREIRLAQNYQITGSTTAGNSLIVTDVDNNQTNYFLENGAVLSRRAGASQPLTSSQIVRVTNLTFSSNAAASLPSARVQPFVSILLTVEPAQSLPGRPETQSPYTLKTTVTLRNFNKYR